RVSALMRCGYISVASTSDIISTLEVMHLSTARGPEPGGRTTGGNHTNVAQLTLKQLLEAGVHFGHQTSRWNPKMKTYIFTARNGIHIIDLQKTVRLLDDAS